MKRGANLRPPFPARPVYSLDAARRRQLGDAVMSIPVAIPVAAAVATGGYLRAPPRHGQPAPSHPDQIVELLTQLGDVRVHLLDAPIDVLLRLVGGPVRRTRKHQLLFGFHF